MVSFPNAKINLGLYVLNKRIDGYHNIISIFLPISWSDILEIIPISQESKSGELICTGHPIDCTPESNLVLKAKKAVERYIGKKLHCNIYLRKIIPDGAGLGGGSSDASFCIKLLNEVYELQLSTEEMTTISMEIGSDCPFFIENSPKLVTGRGETLSSISIPHHDKKIIVIKPPVRVSTAEAYKHVEFTRPCLPLEDIVKMPIDTWRHKIANAFEPYVLEVHPELADIKNVLYESGAIYCSMSGSGSAFYGIFDENYDNLTDVCKYFRSSGNIVYNGIVNF